MSEKKDVEKFFKGETRDPTKKLPPLAPQKPKVKARTPAQIEQDIKDLKNEKQRLANTRYQETLVKAKEYVKKFPKQGVSEEEQIKEARKIQSKLREIEERSLRRGFVNSPAGELEDTPGGGAGGGSSYTPPSFSALSVMTQEGLPVSKKDPLTFGPNVDGQALANTGLSSYYVNRKPGDSTPGLKRFDDPGKSLGNEIARASTFGSKPGKRKNPDEFEEEQDSFAPAQFDVEDPSIEETTRMGEEGIEDYRGMTAQDVSDEALRRSKAIVVQLQQLQEQGDESIRLLGGQVADLWGESDVATHSAESKYNDVPNSTPAQQEMYSNNNGPEQDFFTSAPERNYEESGYSRAIRAYDPTQDPYDFHFDDIRGLNRRPRLVDSGEPVDSGIMDEIKINAEVNKGNYWTNPRLAAIDGPDNNIESKGAVSYDERLTIDSQARRGDVTDNDFIPSGFTLQQYDMGLRRSEARRLFEQRTREQDLPIGDVQKAGGGGKTMNIFMGSKKGPKREKAKDVDLKDVRRFRKAKGGSVFPYEVPSQTHRTNAINLLRNSDATDSRIDNELKA